MLDFIGTVVTATLMVFAVNAVIVFMDISRFAKLALALAVGLWIGLSAAAGVAGMIAISKPFPVVGIFVALPLLAAAIATGWPAARTAMLSVPMPLMIGLNIGRIFAVLPSTYGEGIPKTLLEAAACARPVVAVSFPAGN